MEIKLTQGKVAIIDDEDWELVRVYRWWVLNGQMSNTYYARTKVRRENGSWATVLMHRLLLGLVDPKINCDHIDGNGLNNRRENLRVCSNAENQHNRGAYTTNTSGYKGVSWHNQHRKWRAYIMLNGKWRHLGYHQTPEAAYAAYCAAAVELHGEFANLGAPS